MGLFKKLSQGIDPAIVGGPSNRSLAADDPMLQPINGISLADYAAVSKQAQARQVTDEAGMLAIAQEMGFDPTAFGAATKEWIARMGTSQAVGKAFRAELGY
jgi:hypothetical protein